MASNLLLPLDNQDGIYALVPLKGEPYYIKPGQTGDIIDPFQIKVDLYGVSGINISGVVVVGQDTGLIFPFNILLK
jgi:hypothetical protein